MTKVKQPVTVYVDYNNQEVLNEEEYQARLEEKLEEMLEDEWEFNDWLAAEYTIRELFDMTADEREEALERWHSTCEENARDSLAENDNIWSAEITVEVWVPDVTETQQNLNGWKG